MLRSVDWLTITQTFPSGSLPFLGAGWVLSIDASGDREWEVVRAFSHEGSHDTRVRIRSDGSRLEWSGNPSRFNRADNVWGYATVLEAVLYCVNPMLESLGLPGFDHGGSRVTHTKDAASLRTVAREDLDVEHSGAILTRVDLATMLAAGGSRDRDAVLRAMGQITQHGKAAVARPGSVSWGSKRMVSHIAYDKAREMLAHKKSIKDPQTLEYVQKLAQWLDRRGALRLESKLGRDWLRKHGYRRLRDWDDGQVHGALDDMIRKALPDVGGGGLADIAERLQVEGVPANASYHAQGLAYQWASGVDVFPTMTRPTAYRYRTILKKVGIDIRRPCEDVTALNVKPRVIDLAPLSAPDWYRHAA